MRKTGLPLLAFALLLALLTVVPQSWGASPIRLQVKTILASQDGDGIDPKLRGLTRDLQSVFRYSSYRLIGQNSLRLQLNTPGSVSLPGGRNMTITPEGLSGGRATLKLQIFSGRRQSFQTVIRLRNNSSLTVGGPRFQGGYLLFNIYTSF